MKHIVKSLAIIAALAIVALAPANANAASILTFNANQNGGVITVSGTTESSMLAVAISVYNADGSELLVVETAAVDNGAFSHAITLEAGNYQICAADYDGGDQTCTTLTTTEEITNTTDSSATTGSPETGYNKASDDSAAASDNTWMIIVAAAIAVVGTVAIILIHRHARSQVE